MTNGINQFDATASGLGYIYQIRYALLLALKKIHEVDDPDDCFVSIETLDDIAFEENGTPFELLQTKYHGNPGNLTDRSPDIWKTLRVWCEAIKSGIVSLGATSFILVTTEAAADESIAKLLLPEPDCRDCDSALANLRDISASQASTANQQAYDAFNSLEGWQQEQLVESIIVLCWADDIETVRTKITKQLRTSISPEYLDVFTTRLEGVWFKKVVEIFSNPDEHSVCIGELVAEINDLSKQFHPGNLPADFDDIEPAEIDIAGDQRIFVEQLRLIGSNSKAIRIAIINYYRAFEQTARWSRESLIQPGELMRYQNRLKEEWETHCALAEPDTSHDDEALKHSGRELYRKCQTDGSQPIRRNFEAPYVARGTYHALSERLEIGWHRDYLSLLEPANEEGAA